jgi:hypothetical protein
MVVIVPVAVAMPAMVMFIPPLLALSPATLASFVQFMAPVVCLPATISMVLNGFVEFVLRVRGSPVAIVVGRGSRREKQQACSKRGQDQQLSRKQICFS